MIRLLLVTLLPHCVGVTKFDPATGKQFKGQSTTQSYTTYFAEALIAEAEVDKDIVAIHAAMGGGTGLNLFQRRFPTRCFDVGIAEQHAVTFAAGLACEGLKPFCAIYSSFMQRAYDQARLLILPFLSSCFHCRLYPTHRSMMCIMLLATCSFHYIPVFFLSYLLAFSIDIFEIPPPVICMRFLV